MFIYVFVFSPDNKKNVNNNVWCNSCKRTVFDLECRMPGIANMLPSCQTQVSFIFNS